MNMAWSRKSEKSKDHRNTEQEYHTVVVYKYTDYIVNMNIVLLLSVLCFKNSYYISMHQINFNWS